MKKPLPAIQPRQGIAGADKLREFHLVGSGVVVVVVVPCIVVPCAASGVRRARAALCALRYLDVMNDILQFLLMAILVGHRRFQRLDAH
jgi:hypothetical protein